MNFSMKTNREKLWKHRFIFLTQRVLYPSPLPSTHTLWEISAKTSSNESNNCLFQFSSRNSSLISVEVQATSWGPVSRKIKGSAVNSSLTRRFIFVNLATLLRFYTGKFKEKQSQMWVRICPISPPNWEEAGHILAHLYDKYSKTLIQYLPYNTHFNSYFKLSECFLWHLLCPTLKCLSA